MHRNVCRGRCGVVGAGEPAYYDNSQCKGRNPVRLTALLVRGIGLLTALSCEGQAIRQNTNAIVREAWGLDLQKVRKGVFECPVPLSLGPLEQRGLLLLAKDPVPFSPFGGIRVDGLLSHAFLKQYVWTIDFDERVYMFSW